MCGAQDTRRWHRWRRNRSSTAAFPQRVFANSGHSRPWRAKEKARARARAHTHTHCYLSLDDSHQSWNQAQWAPPKAEGSWRHTEGTRGTADYIHPLTFWQHTDDLNSMMNKRSNWHITYYTQQQLTFAGEIVTKIDHVLGESTRFNKYQRTKVTESMLCCV